MTSDSSLRYSRSSVLSALGSKYSIFVWILRFHDRARYRQSPQHECRPAGDTQASLPPPRGCRIISVLVGSFLARRWLIARCRSICGSRDPETRNSSPDRNVLQCSTGPLPGVFRVVAWPSRSLALPSGMISFPGASSKPRFLLRTSSATCLPLGISTRTQRRQFRAMENIINTESLRPACSLSLGDLGRWLPGNNNITTLLLFLVR